MGSANELEEHGDESKASYFIIDIGSLTFHELELNEKPYSVSWVAGNCGKTLAFITESS